MSPGPMSSAGGTDRMVLAVASPLGETNYLSAGPIKNKTLIKEINLFNSFHTINPVF